jgi:hypothetical protein
MYLSPSQMSGHPNIYIVAGIKTINRSIRQDSSSFSIRCPRQDITAIGCNVHGG